MRVLTFLSFFLLFFACSKKPTFSFQGIYKMELQIQEKFIPFYIEVKDESHLVLHNGAEQIELTYEIEEKTGEIRVPILNYDAAIFLKPGKGELFGHWEKFNRDEPYILGVRGTKTSSIQKPSKLENFPLKWKISFIDEGKVMDGILFFTTKDDITFASILTQTGDYRFLNPELKADKLLLYGFDGAFSFYFEGILKENQYSGKMYAGKDWNQLFKAEVNPQFELKDPTNITTFKGKLTEIILPTLSGEPRPLINEVNKDKVKVIQIFGSWCPNCIDETNFIKKWREENKGKHVDFSLISFERAPNKKQALKLLKKTRDLYNIDYPIFIGGYTKDDKVSNVLPGIENFISFPTTIFVDKKNQIRKIHAGFSGPATGKYYDKFIQDFNAIIDKLLSEE